MPIYAAWDCDDGNPMFVGGVARPTFGDGSLIPGVTRLLFTVVAPTWEAACCIYHARMGWEPYRPMTETDWLKVAKSSPRQTAD